MTRSPKISVIIPAYNVEGYIAEAIKSVLQQTEQDFEVIVIDDGSTDGTREKVQNIIEGDRRIQFMANDHNRGVSYSRNKGIESARGEWVTMLDADDWYDPRRLEILVRETENHGVNIAGDNQYFIDDLATRPWRTLFPEKGEFSTYFSVDDFLALDLPEQHGTFGLIQPFICRSFLTSEGITYDENMLLGEDSTFLIQCFAKTHRILFIRQPLYYYRQRSDSLISNQEIEDLMRLRDANNSFLEVFSGENHRRTRELLRRRGRAIEKYARYRNVVGPLRKRRWMHAIVNFLADPGIFPFLTVNGIKVFRARLKRHWRRVF